MKLKIAFTDTGAKDAPVITLFMDGRMIYMAGMHFALSLLRLDTGQSPHTCAVLAKHRLYLMTLFRDGRGVALAQDGIDLADGTSWSATIQK